MKTATLLFLFTCIGFCVQAQYTTNYGSYTGTLGYVNSYFGYGAGSSSTSSTSFNSFFGVNAGLFTTASFNSGFGVNALLYNTSGTYNVAMGDHALASNTDGSYNTAFGSGALATNTSGVGNVASGYRALASTTIGAYNTVSGFKAMEYNTYGSYNTATGQGALWSNVSGQHNTAIGHWAFPYNTTGFYNTVVGSMSMPSASTGSYNTAIGYGVDMGNYSNSMALGALTVCTGSNQVRIGNANVTSIGGQVSWSTLSDGRFKKEIKEDVSGLAFINQLRPVSYTIDNEGLNKFLGISEDNKKQMNSAARTKVVRQTGFIAQEVEAVIKKTGYVFHGVEAPQSETDHYSIRYAEFVVPLVKAVQELTTLLNEQQAKIDELLAQTNKSESDVIQSKQKNILLLQNNPNPFTVDTEISMDLPEGVRQATIMVYALDGKEIKSIPVHNRGHVAVKIQANELNAGMYIYSLIADSKVIDTKRMILTK